MAYSRFADKIQPPQILHKVRREGRGQRRKDRGQKIKDRRLRTD